MSYTIKRLLGGRVVCVVTRYAPYQAKYLTPGFYGPRFKWERPGFAFVTRAGLFVSVYWTEPAPDRSNRDPWLRVLGVRS